MGCDKTKGLEERAVNCGAVTRKLYGENEWKIKVIFVGLLIQFHFDVNSQALLIRMFSS